MALSMEFAISVHSSVSSTVISEETSAFIFSSRFLLLAFCAFALSMAFMSVLFVYCCVIWENFVPSSFRYSTAFSFSPKSRYVAITVK